VTRGPALAGRVAAVATAVFAAVVATAPAASAHTVGGVAATDYQSRIVGLSPPARGISARLLDLGRRIEVTNSGPTELVVLGYQGEAYLRIGPDGVFENIHSPAVYQNRPLPAGVTSTTLPAIAQPSDPPEWRKIGAGRTATWSDRRTRWEGARPAAVARHPGRVTAVTTWAIPLSQNSATIHLEGRIVWVPPPDPWPWLAVAVVFFLVAVVVGRSRWWGPGLGALLALLVASDIARYYAAALISGGTIAMVLLRTLIAGAITSVVWVLGAWGIALLQAERERGLLVGALTGFGTGLFSGVTDLPYVLHSQVPVAAPTALARGGVALAVGLGFGVATACVLRFRHLPPEQRDQVRGRTRAPGAPVA
jgi:hypothetical protein